MGKKKEKKARAPRYRAMSPKHKHLPRLCACGEEHRRISLFGLGANRLAWQCPKCGVTEGPAAGLVGGFDEKKLSKPDGR